MVAMTLVATLAACSSSDNGGDDPIPPAEASVMTLGATSASQPYSRAASPLEESYADFGVWAYKTDADGATQGVMHHSDGTPYEVIWTGNAWRYDILSDSYQQYLRYWDLAARDYTFDAYAPCRHGGDYVITRGDDGVCISPVQGNRVTSALPDWIVSRHRRVAGSPTGADYDLYDGGNLLGNYALTSSVGLVFHHILSVIDFRVYNKGTGTAVITSVSITIGEKVYTVADFVGGSFTDLRTEESDVLVRDGLAVDVPPSTRETAVRLAELLELPQTVDAKNWSITVTLQGGRTLTGTFALDGAWEASNRYIYYLGLSDDTDIILMDVDVELYRWREGNTIETDPVINW